MPQAPFASIRIPTSGPTAARTAANRPASSPIPTLTFTHRNPARAAAAAAAAAPARSSAPIVAFTGTAPTARGSISRASGVPVRRDAWSHRARSIAASAWGRSRSARQASSTSAVGSSPRNTSA